MAGPAQEVRFARLATGTRIAWACSGRGPVLLRAAHWMTHIAHDPQSAVWGPWIAQLSRRVRLVRYDERGCGLSGRDDAGPPSLDTAVEDLAAVADATGAPRLALLGISSGAAVAVAYAARRPERVSHLVLLGGYAHGVLAGAPSAEQRAWVDATASLVELGWGHAGAPVQQFFTATLLPEGRPEHVQALNEQQRLCCDGARAAAILRARAASDVRPLLGEVRAPTLVLHIDGDATVAAERGRALAAGIAGARFVTLPGRNHIPLVGDPAFAPFCEALMRFVGSSAEAPDTRFTPRQQALLTLVAQGRDNLQIAAELGIAEKTVRNALVQLYAALQVEGRPQAVVRARELGFG
jgi:pimeloyl-ACP methyl ester carboxylesterase